MFCGECGSELEASARFCPSCGATVGGKPSQEQASTDANATVVVGSTPAASSSFGAASPGATVVATPTPGQAQQQAQAPYAQRQTQPAAYAQPQQQPAAYSQQPGAYAYPRSQQPQPQAAPYAYGAPARGTAPTPAAQMPPAGAGYYAQSTAPAKTGEVFGYVTSALAIVAIICSFFGLLGFSGGGYSLTFGMMDVFTGGSWVALASGYSGYDGIFFVDVMTELFDQAPGLGIAAVAMIAVWALGIVFCAICAVRGFLRKKTIVAGFVLFIVFSAIVIAVGLLATGYADSGSYVSLEVMPTFTAWLLFAASVAGVVTSVKGNKGLIAAGR